VKQRRAGRSRLDARRHLFSCPCSHRAAP
jgi:hypothetical protein